MSPAPAPALVVIPTYQERATLPGTLARLRAAVPAAHALVVDDASPDGTGDWAETAAAEDSHVHVLHRAGKEGLGPAYLAGFAWGLERGYEVLVEMDADASHRPEQLPGLLEAVRRGADLAIGSRWVPGGRVHDWPLRRLILSRGRTSTSGRRSACASPTPPPGSAPTARGCSPSWSGRTSPPRATASRWT